MKIIDEGVVKTHLDAIKENLDVGFSLMEIDLNTEREKHVKAMGMKTTLDDISRQVAMIRLYIKED